MTDQINNPLHFDNSNLPTPPVQIISNKYKNEEKCVDCPDFSFMDDHSSSMLISAYMVVHKNNYWSYLANFTGEYFMFTTDKTILIIMNEIEAESTIGHSGCSMGWTMRQLESIAIYGFEHYKYLCEMNNLNNR